MTVLGKGWNTRSAPKSPAHHLGLGHPSHLSAVAIPRAAEVSLGPVLDQGATSSCTGHASAIAIQAAMTKAAGLLPGQWLELPSRLFLYYMPRAAEGVANIDDGAVISVLFNEAALVGFPRESAWTFSEDLAKITTQPDWAAWRAAADQKVGIDGAWRIASSGAQRLIDTMSAIAVDQPVVWGTELDYKFEDLRVGQVWPGVTGPPIGGHAMAAWQYSFDEKMSDAEVEEATANLLGYGIIPDGLTLMTRSSWGDRFCDNGSARISARSVASPDADDFWIVRPTPAYSEAA